MVPAAPPQPQPEFQFTAVAPTAPHTRAPAVGGLHKDFAPTTSILASCLPTVPSRVAHRFAELLIRQPTAAAVLGGQTCVLLVVGTKPSWRESVLPLAASTTPYTPAPRGKRTA